MDDDGDKAVLDSRTLGGLPRLRFSTGKQFSLLPVDSTLIRSGDAFVRSFFFLA